MPTQINIESPHQRQTRLDRDERRRNRQWDRVVGQQRGETEQADELNRQSSRIEGHVARYDTDEQFRERVADERAARRTKLVVWAYIVLIAVIDVLLATPDVSEYLANKAMVYIPKAWTLVEIINGHEVVITPVWWRLVVAANLVAAFLGITLGFKSVTNESKIQARRNAVEPGDTRNYNRLTWGIWFLRLLKLGYMALLGLLFFHLYDYDLQRSDLIAKTMLLESQMEQAAAPQLQGADSAGQPKPEGGSAGQGVAASPGSGAGLAKASAVVFCCLWLLHGILFLTGSDCFGRDLEFANFQRGPAENQATSMRKEEVNLLRNIRDRMFSVPEGDQRNQLLRIALPVGERINQVSGFDVIPRELLATGSASGVARTVNPQAGSSAAPTDPVSPVHHGTNGHNHVAPAAAPINGSNGQHPIDTNEDEDSDPYDLVMPSPRR
ncbi:MAG: hypothetical protein WCH98_00525 [Verrucomicrobiota bacterium]